MHAIILLLLLTATAGPLHAQGMLPGSSTVVTSTGPLPTIGIGQEVPDTLRVRTPEGVERSASTYKRPLDILVIAFLSARCPEQEAQWAKLKRLYAQYSGWHVAFMVVNEGPAASIEDLQKMMKKYELDVPLAQDDQRQAARVFKISSVPAYAVIDESRYLQYRGPLDKLGPALDALIGHIENVRDPDLPTGGCTL